MTATTDSALLREVLQIAPPGARPPDPRRLLEELLRPARDPGTDPDERLEAYRLLLLALEGNLWDHDFALLVHREWMGFSTQRSKRPRRRARRPAEGPASRSARR